MNKKILSLVVAGALAQTGCSTDVDNKETLAASQEHERPNILFIMSDDHAVQALSAYGHEISKIAPTPNIDRIAESGVKFTSSYVTNSLCGPSRAAMFTGKFGHKNGFNYNGQTFDGTQDHWANKLQDSGYTTAMIGKWHINRIPDGFKFDHWDILNDQGEYYNPDFITPEGVEMEMGYTTDLITDKVIAWLDEGRDKDKPFALLMHHKAPHRNWMPAPRHTQTFAETEFPVPETYFDDYDGRVAAQNQKLNIYRDTQEGHDLKMTTGVGETEWRRDIWPHLLERLTPEQRAEWDAAYQERNDWFNANEADMTEEEIAIWKYQRYMQDYLATIKAVDESVGEVLDYLEANDLTDNTLVVYTSDQGFFLGEHGFFDKRFMYEETFSTPLVMQLPGRIAPGTVVDELVQNIDYAPTFMELAGVEAYPEIDGESLVELMTTGEAQEWRSSLYYHFYELPGFHRVARHYGVSDGDYKLIHFYFPDDNWEFYDLSKDPNEMNNAIDDPAYKAEIARMHEELESLKKQYSVPPKEEWESMDLKRKPKERLEDLFPHSFENKE